MMEGNDDGSVKEGSEGRKGKEVKEGKGGRKGLKKGIEGRD